MARYENCEKCYHRYVCGGDVDKWSYYGECSHYINSADVVPKSEVERLRNHINRLKKYDEERDIALHSRLIAETRKEVAREIFEEIEDVLNNIGYFDEIDFLSLKKKYTESEDAI